MGRAHQRLAELFVYEGREQWEWRSACIGKGKTFFPGKGEKEKVREAKAICYECPVLEHCRAEVKKNPPEYGVWAGRLYQPTKSSKESDGK